MEYQYQLLYTRWDISERDDSFNTPMLYNLLQTEENVDTLLQWILYITEKYANGDYIRGYLTLLLLLYRRGDITVMHRLFSLTGGCKHYKWHLEDIEEKNYVYLDDREDYRNLLRILCGN